MISQLKTKSNEKLDKTIPLEGFIQSNIQKYDEKGLVKTLVEHFESLPGQEFDIEPEISIWKSKWPKENITNTVMETKKHCDGYFPIIQILLKIYAVIPVTKASPDKGFSILTPLKN